MATFLEAFTPKAIAMYWNQVQSNKIPYLGEGFFPNDKKMGLDLSWIKGHTGLPVSLMPSAFDAKATFRDREGFSKTETEMPFFREGYKLKEKDRQDIIRLRENPNNAYMEDILRRIYDDVGNLIEGARVVRERMRMALLFPASGNMTISFNANGVSYVYNYDPGNAWKGTNYFDITSTPTRKWSATSTADPFVDIQTVKDAINATTGADLTIAILNSVTFNKLMKINAVKNRFLTKNGMNVAYLTKGEVARVVEDTVGVRFVIYDKQYKDESGTAHKFVPDDYVTLVPAGPLGKTWFGTTPEEADLMDGSHDVTLVDRGVAILRTVHEHPVGLNVFASEIVLPSFERMDEVAVMKVDAA